MSERKSERTFEGKSGGRSDPGGDAPTCPLPREQVIDRYFLEHRQKVLDVAAFLDRLERAAPAEAEMGEDYRIEALGRALDVLRDGRPHRARRVLETLSDSSDAPAASAASLGPATGAPRA